MRTLLLLISQFLFVITLHGQDIVYGERRYTSLPEEYTTPDTLFIIHSGDVYELGVPCGYVNRQGDTLIPFGRYHYCFFDTVTTFAIVGDTTGVYAIDRNFQRLFEVYWFDNGIDYLQDGLFRIKRFGKIGYANEEGVVVIEPQYACANPFSEGKARVTYDCRLKKDGDYNKMLSSDWFYIDTGGKRIIPENTH
jgi:hypothetical protein